MIFISIYSYGKEPQGLFIIIILLIWAIIVFKHDHLVTERLKNFEIAQTFILILIMALTLLLNVNERNNLDSSINALSIIFILLFKFTFSLSFLACFVAYKSNSNKILKKILSQKIVVRFFPSKITNYLLD